MNLDRVSLCSIFFTLVLALPMQALSNDAVYSKTVTGDFADIRIDVESAILDRGLVIDFHAKVGEMLERTAADVGSTVPVFENADSWQFCSAALSRKMVEADPANIAYCPYVVFAYATSDAPDNIVVGFRRHISSDEASMDVLAEVDDLLKSIVDEVVE